jgi:glycosyltransferase involved in cell wall biosynthesis
MQSQHRIPEEVNTERRSEANDADKSDRRIIVAHMLPWTGIAGTELATLRIATLVQGHFRHVALCMRDAGELKELFAREGIETYDYTPPTPSLRHGSRYFQESRTLANLISKVGATIVHFADIQAAYAGSLAALLAHVKMVCHVRCSYPSLGFRYRLSCLPIHSFVFVSHHARHTFGLSIAESKSRVVYDAIDRVMCCSEQGESVRNEFGIPSNCTIVGMVARVNPQKDFVTLASAAAHVLSKHPNVRFLIVGDNAIVDINRRHFAKVSEYLRCLQIESSFIFTGYRSDTQRLISAMDVVVLSTHREGFPLSILEAMALRKPVVATSVGGIPEIIVSGETGYLHRPGDSSELARAILTLVENPDEAARIGEAAYRGASAKCSLQRFIEEMSQVYSEIANTESG